jgi:hypothetical protein
MFTSGVPMAGEPSADGLMELATDLGKPTAGVAVVELIAGELRGELSV